VRQKDDPEFAALLNRLRFGCMTEGDVETLKIRVIEVPPGAEPLEVFAEKYRSLRASGGAVVCLCDKNAMVSQFN